MITVETAYEIAKKQLNKIFDRDVTVTKILDAGTFWFFGDEIGDKCPIGHVSVAIMKKDGKVFPFWPPDLTDEQLDAADNAKSVPIPQ